MIRVTQSLTPVQVNTGVVSSNEVERITKDPVRSWMYYNLCYSTPHPETLSQNRDAELETLGHCDAECVRQAKIMVANYKAQSNPCDQLGQKRVREHNKPATNIFGTIYFRNGVPVFPKKTRDDFCTGVSDCVRGPCQSFGSYDDETNGMLRIPPNPAKQNSIPRPSNVAALGNDPYGQTFPQCTCVTAPEYNVCTSSSGKHLMHCIEDGWDKALCTKMADAMKENGYKDGACEWKDCNGAVNGGAQELACGCDDATSCLDCNGVPNGPGQELACGCDDADSCKTAAPTASPTPAPTNRCTNRCISCRTNRCTNRCTNPEGTNPDNRNKMEKESDMQNKFANIRNLVKQCRESHAGGNGDDGIDGSGDIDPDVPDVMDAADSSDTANGGGNGGGNGDGNGMGNGMGNGNSDAEVPDVEGADAAGGMGRKRARRTLPGDRADSEEESGGQRYCREAKSMLNEIKAECDADGQDAVDSCAEYDAEAKNHESAMALFNNVEISGGDHFSTGCVFTASAAVLAVLV